MAPENEMEIDSAVADSVLRDDNVAEQIDKAYELCFPIERNGIQYTGLRFWPSIELTGRVQEMIFDSAYLRTKSWDTPKAILSRVIKEFVTDDGNVLQVAPQPRGALTYSRPVPKYAEAEKLVDSLSEPDSSGAAFLYQRDFIDDSVVGKYTCGKCSEEFSMDENLTDYRVASRKESILRFIIGVENGSTLAEMHDLLEGEDIEALWNERFQDGYGDAKFVINLKKGYMHQGVICKKFVFKVLTMREVSKLAKRILDVDKNKPMAATHARLNAMLIEVPDAPEALLVSRGAVIKGLGAADYGILANLLPSAFDMIYTASTRVCPDCGFKNRDMQLDTMTFFGMGSSM